MVLKGSTRISVFKLPQTKNLENSQQTSQQIFWLQADFPGKSWSLGQNRKVSKSSIYQGLKEEFGSNWIRKEIKDGASEGTRIFTKTLHHAKSFKSLLFCILFRCFPTLNGTLKRKVVTKTVTTMNKRIHSKITSYPRFLLGFRLLYPIKFFIA